MVRRYNAYAALVDHVAGTTTAGDSVSVGLKNRPAAVGIGAFVAGAVFGGLVAKL